MRKGAWLLAIAVAGLLAAVATGGAGARPARTGSERLARRDAQTTLARLRLPPGATPTAGDPAPSNLLGSAPDRPATRNLVDVHAFWRVPGAPKQVLAWIESHPPAGSRLGMGGESVSSGSGVITAFDGFGWPIVPGVLSYRELLVTVAQARGGGTALRADAQSVWLAPRTASERIPAGVSVITISERRLRGSSRGPWTVSDRRRVRRIVALVNGLRLGPVGPVACPADVGPYVTLRFASAGHGIARVVADASGCGFVSLSIHGRREPFLAGGVRLIRQLSSLLGTSLR